MSLLKILKYGHPLLREKALDIKQVGAGEKELFAAMGETMYNAAGIGLAATQVGVMQRIFVLDIDQERSDDPGDEIGSRRLQIFINPEIIWESEEDSPLDEGCLSIPSVNREIFRPSKIKIHARDENFESFEMEMDGLLARVFQHELDHLNGILFIDHLSRMSRALAAGDLNRIKIATQAELAEVEEKYPVYV